MYKLEELKTKIISSFKLVIMSISAREFQINLFSNTDGYEQKLSSFSNVLNPSLYLNPEFNWHVGINSICLPKFTAKNNNVIESSDVLNINSASKMYFKKEQLWSISELAEYLVHMCEHPEIYTNKYFQKYLLAYNYDITRWKDIHKDDIISTDPNNENVCSFVFNLEELLERNEKLEEFLPEYKALTRQRSFFKRMEIKLNVNHSYKLTEIINTCIRHLVVMLKVDSKHPSNYRNLIDEHFKNGLFSSNSFAFRRITNYINEIIMRFVKKLIDNIQKFSSESLKMSVNEMDVNYLFFYCSVIKENYVGNKRGRIMLILPNEQLSKTNSLIFSNVLYNPIESFLIDEIRVLITDEFGQRIKFHDSFIPTFIGLTFKAMSVRE